MQTDHYICFAIGPSLELAPAAQPTLSVLRFGYHGYYMTDAAKAGGGG